MKAPSFLLLIVTGFALGMVSPSAWSQTATMAGDDLGRLRNQTIQNTQILNAIFAQLQQQNQLQQQQINAEYQQRLAAARAAQQQRDVRSKGNYYRLYCMLREKIPDLEPDAVSQSASTEDLKKVFIKYLRNSGVDWTTANHEVDNINSSNLRDTLNYH